MSYLCSELQEVEAQRECRGMCLLQALEAPPQQLEDLLHGSSGKWWCSEPVNVNHLKKLVTASSRTSSVSSSYGESGANTLSSCDRHRAAYSLTSCIRKLREHVRIICVLALDIQLQHLPCPDGQARYQRLGCLRHLVATCPGRPHPVELSPGHLLVAGSSKHHVSGAPA